MSITKQGIITSPNIYESEGTNILLNSEKYTMTNPWIAASSSTDGYITTDMYCRVTPGEVYYFTCQTDSQWASGHFGNKGEVTIWLYLLKTYDPSNLGYDSPILFTSSNWVAKGIWKYTIPDGYNMARVRFNTYSDGANSVTCKFWDVRLIPEKYYVPSTPPTSGNSVSLHIGKDYISAGEIYEI